MFSIIYQGPHGDTVSAADPRLTAYKQAAYIRRLLGRNFTLTVRADGCYTVAGDGLAPITFEKRLTG
jgi:hypothetical protein